MFLIKILDNLLKAIGAKVLSWATLECTVPRVAQLEADEHPGLVNYLAGCSRGWRGEGAGVVEHYDGNVCSQSWYRLKTHLGRLYGGSVVYNIAFF